MSAHPLVPADIEADAIIDLVQDCREISGVGLDGYGGYGS